MKKSYAGVFFLFFIVFITGCSNKVIEERPEKVIPVQAVRMHEKERIPRASFFEGGRERFLYTDSVNPL